MLKHRLARTHFLPNPLRIQEREARMTRRVSFDAETAQGANTLPRQHSFIARCQWIALADEIGRQKERCRIMILIEDVFDIFARRRISIVKGKHHALLSERLVRTICLPKGTERAHGDLVAGKIRHLLAEVIEWQRPGIALGGIFRDAMVDENRYLFCLHRPLHSRKLLRCRCAPRSERFSRMRGHE